MTHRTPSWNAQDYSRSCISIRRSATRTSHDSRRGRRNDLPLALSVFKLWIGRKTEDHAFTAVAGDDPGSRGHEKRLGEIGAKVKPAAILILWASEPRTRPHSSHHRRNRARDKDIGREPRHARPYRHLAGKSNTGISGSRHLPAGDGRVTGRHIAGRRNSGRLANLECGQIPGARDLIRTQSSYETNEGIDTIASNEYQSTGLSAFPLWRILR